MAEFKESPCYSHKLGKALQFAYKVHQYQVRKNSEIPYLCHLLQVAGLVMEARGTEEEVIAALLHDAVEDVGVSLKVLREEFGEQVASMVAALSEDLNLAPRCRKRAYVESISHASSAVKLVSCADKLHNLRGYATTGKNLWDAAKAEFYKSLIPVYETCLRIPSHYVREMRQLLATLELESFQLEVCRAVVTQSEPGYSGTGYYADLLQHKVFCEESPYSCEGIENVVPVECLVESEPDYDPTPDWDIVEFPNELLEDYRKEFPEFESYRDVASWAATSDKWHDWYAEQFQRGYEAAVQLAMMSFREDLLC